MAKSLSKTPAPKKDRIFGSDKNKKGSASSKASAKGIDLNDSIIETLSNKAKEYNEKHPNSKVSVTTLKAVMRRGMGAYSTSHRPTITGGAPNSRQAWGFARVNKFLKKKEGQQVKAAYVQDDDLMADGGETKKSKEAYTLVAIYRDPKTNDYSESEDLTKEGLLGYRLRYNKAPNQYYGYRGYDNTESELERAKRDLERYNKQAEEEKERKKLKDIENKIKREKQKIIDAQKLESAKSDNSAKPAYLMTKSEYEDRVIPLLKEYEKFARKNSEYLANTSYSGLYKTTYEQVLSRALEGKNTGRRFDADSEKGAIRNWNYTKYNRYGDDKMEIPTPTPKDIVEKNSTFFNDLQKFFSDKVIFDSLDSEYKKSNKPEIRRAIEDDTYKKLLENGEITEEQVIKIAEEHGIKVPKRVFSQESNLKKEAKKQMDEILSKIPKMNKDVFDSLYNQLFEDFKDVEKVVFEREKERYEVLIKECIELSKKEGGINEDKLQSSISFWKLIFKESKSIAIYGKDSRGYPTSQYFQKNLELKSDYKPVMDKIILDYAESLKYRFLKSVLENFPKVSKPITNIEKKKIDLGVKGFEGRYRFNFADGSYFDFVTEAIPAAGYNIVAFHYRYLTHLENATLADGTKVKGYYEIMDKFSSESMADGGEVGLTEIAQDVYISKDKDKLPKDATIVIHRYNDDIKAGELGLFAGNLEDMELDDGYGKNKAYISIGKNAKLKKIRSTSRYLEDLGEFDKPREYIQEKYGYDSLLDLMDDAGSLNNPSDAWYETQKVAISKMRESGEDFDVLEMTYEEDYIPHQYLITTLKNSKIKFKDGGQIYADGGQTGQAITCVNCGWHWNTADSDEFDKYICHKCGFDNRTFYDPEPIGIMADGGELDYRKDALEFFKKELGIKSDVILVQSKSSFDPMSMSQLMGGVPLTSVKNNKFYVLVDFDHTKNRFIRTLAHELVHVKQMEDERLRFEGDKIIFDDEKMTYDEYQKRYHSDDIPKFEDEAFNLERVLQNKYAEKEGSYADGGVMGQELFKPSKTIEQIAKEKDVPLDYAEEQLKKGMKTESEHSDNPMVQETIALQHLDEMIDYYEKLEYMENQNKMEKGGVTQFYKEYLDWYKDGVFDKMTIMLSVPNSFSKMSHGENDLILDVFEKKDENVDAKKKLTELLEIVDRNGLDVYLEPIPRLYNIKDKAKREKITKEYLIKYYEKFGFELLPNGFMVRKHNKMEKGGYYKAGGEINPDNKSVKDYFSHGSGNVGGVLVGKRHSEGGIKAVNKSTNQPLEMEGGEVVITRNAVSDNTKREFNGEMLTNREILSKINESGGGVSFADGGDIPETISTSGKEYKYGGKMMKDHEIVSSCGCNHSMAEGGLVYKKIYNRGGGGYTTIINGMEYSINKQYGKGTWVAQSDDGEYYKEAQTLSDLKYYLENLKKDSKDSYAEGGEIDYHTEIKNHLFPKVEVEVEVEVEPEMDLIPIHEHFITADDLGLSDGMPMLAVGTIIYSSGGNDQWELVSFSDDGVNLVNNPKSPLQSKMEDKHLTFEELIKYFKDKAISIKNISTERELEPAIALVKNKLPQKSFAVGGLVDGDEDEDAKIMQSQFGKSNFK